MIMKKLYITTDSGKCLNVVCSYADSSLSLTFCVFLAFDVYFIVHLYMSAQLMLQKLERC